MFALMQTVKGVSNSKGSSNREVYSKNIIKYEEQYLIKITSITSMPCTASYYNS